MYTIIYNRPNGQQFIVKLDDEQLAKDILSNLRFVNCEVLFYPMWDTEGKFVGHTN